MEIRFNSIDLKGQNQEQEKLITEQEEQETSFNPFDVYSEMYAQLNNGEISELSSETFNQIMSGEIESDDILALNVIQAAQIDEDIENVSEDELFELYNVYFNEDVTNEDITQQYINAQFENIALMYLGKSASECTSEELNQAYALNLIEGILFSSQQGLANQNAADGLISETYDLLKNITSLGTCQKDVEIALAKQQEIINKLKQAILDGNFEEKYKELTGVEFNEEKIIEYQEQTIKIQFVQSGLEKISAFCDSLSESDSQYNIEETYNKFIEFYGKEQGEEKFLEALKEGYNNCFDSGFYDPHNLIEKTEFDKDGNIIITFANGNTSEIGELKYINPNILTHLYSEDYKEHQLNSYLKTLEEKTDINYQELLLAHNELSKEALGEANAVSNILNDYIMSQEGFIDALASGAQIIGIGLMAIGAVATLCGGGPIGGAILKTGQVFAVGGTFGDEAIEGLDTLTNKQGWQEDKEHYREVLKETMVDSALFFSGMAIGSYASGIADDIYSSTKALLQTKTGSELFAKISSKALSIVSEIGIDGTLSLLTDLTITGEIDLDGEMLSQILGILTGSAMARLNNTDTGKIKISTEARPQNPSSSSTRQLPKLFVDIKNSLEFRKMFPNEKRYSFKTFKEFIIGEEGLKLAQEMQTKYEVDEITSLYFVYKGFSETQVSNFQLATKEYGFNFKDAEKLTDSYKFKDFDNFKRILDAIVQLRTTYDFDTELSSEIIQHSAVSKEEFCKITHEEISQIVYEIKQKYGYTNQECLELVKNGVTDLLYSKIELSTESLNRFIEIRNLTKINENHEILELLNASFDDSQIKRYLEIKEKTDSYDISNLITMVKENYSDEQIARYAEIKKEFGYCLLDDIKYNLTNEEIEYYHKLSKEPDYFSAEQTKIYINAMKSGLGKTQAKLAAIEGYSFEDIAKVTSAISEFKKLKSQRSAINLFAHLDWSETEHLKTCMVQYRIFDFADFNKYIKEIDKTELFELVPSLKEAPTEEILDFFSYHYAAGTEKFDAETLSMDGNLTTYLAQNYTSAYQLTRLLNAHPLASRNVGELPNGWLTSTDSQIQAQKTAEIYDAITDFQKTSDITILTENLKTILGKDVTVKSIGSGALGVAYKISVQDSEPVCLKIFSQGKEEYGVSRHGEHIEPQVALFANEHSNRFAHMFFGRVSGLNDSDGFMVTQFLDWNTTPIQNATDTESFRLWCGDDNGDNNIGKTYIDFGKLGIKDKDGNVVHLWYETTYN